MLNKDNFPRLKRQSVRLRAHIIYIYINLLPQTMNLSNEVSEKVLVRIRQLVLIQIKIM